MIIGVVKETYPGERRVALTPPALAPLQKKKFDILIEPGAGEAAGYPDAAYREKGAGVAAGRSEVLKKADVVLFVRALGANPDAGRADLAHFRHGQIVIGLMEPLIEVQSARALAEAGVTAFALELVPRITRAQSMDVLSSMATVAGYKAVLLAANALPRMFPLLMTAAGTVTAAKALVVGAGVAGLQAIATARRLGAVVHAYDIRPAVKEQVQSLGAKFVELPLDTNREAEDAGGYARAMDEEFYRRQRELMGRVVAESNVVITTAAVPGRKSPVLITADMVEHMEPGSVIVDIAAERGGNCELTRPGETIEHRGVTILGPLNLPSTIPYHASQMFAKNVSTFLLHILKDEKGALDLNDQITAETLVARDGKVVHPRVNEALSAHGG
ncbi:MAG: Re/Si-specific NAD(P)(+) transhydrogenase subunit alpha [Candidatus Sumerlaeia bacterium]